MSEAQPSLRRTDGVLARGPSRVRRPPPSSRRIAQRRFLVNATKWLLPVAALLLLGSIAAWPELTRIKDGARVSFKRVFSLEPDSARMMAPSYRGVDERGRPYTITADWAAQDAPSKVVLSRPRGDATLESGAWLMLQGEQGVYIQHTGELDLQRDVQLYRDDGTAMRSETATINVKEGAAASADMTHAEGPFGVLDAQGFTLTEKGAVIQFHGPARLVVRGSGP